MKGSGLGGSEGEREVRRAVRRLLAGHGYEEVQAAASAATQAVREEVASALASPLNERAAQMPQATYEEKKELAKWVNAQLRPFGLAVRCPATGRPAILHAGVGGDRAVGTFRFDTMAHDGRREQRSWSTRLPQLEPIVDTSEQTPRRTGRGR